MVADTVEVTDYLRERFGQARIYLVGNSWGTLLGVQVVQRRPELFHAFVGTGQMVSPRETDVMFYEDTLAWAQRTGGDTFSILYPQLQGIDFRTDVPSLDVPVYMVIGEHEARGRAVLADEWYEMLEAPSKEKIVFEHSGHRPLFEEPALFAALMTRVLDDTR